MIQREPKVGVIVATHNRPDRLRRLLMALENQKCARSEFRVTVVNDGTHNKAYQKLVEDYRELIQYEALTDRVGPAGARNRGVEISSAPILVFTDDDCVPPPNWIPIALERFGRGSRIEVLGGRIRPLSSENPTVVEKYLIESGFLQSPLFINGSLVCLQTANLAVPRQTFLDSGGFSTCFERPGGEDTDLTYRLLRNSAVVSIAQDWITYHDHRISLAQLSRRYFNYGDGVATHIRLRNETLDYGLLLATSYCSLARQIAEVYRRARIPRIGARNTIRSMVQRILFKGCALVEQISYQVGGVRGLKRRPTTGLNLQPAKRNQRHLN